MIGVQSLACRRGGRLVFRDISFSLETGGLLLVRGANGSGKTSLLRVLAGLIPAAAGAMSWNGADVEGDAGAHRDRLHYIGHRDALKPELTVAEMIEYWRALRPAGNAVPLEAVGLGSLRDRPVRYLSAGQRRRLVLARLLLNDAPLWLLDEPASSLDRGGLAMLDGLIMRHRAKGGMAIIASHQDHAFHEAQHLVMEGAA